VYPSLRKTRIGRDVPRGRRRALIYTRRRCRSTRRDHRTAANWPRRTAPTVSFCSCVSRRTSFTRVTHYRVSLSGVSVNNSAFPMVFRRVRRPTVSYVIKDPNTFPLSKRAYVPAAGAFFVIFQASATVTNVSDESVPCSMYVRRSVRPVLRRRRIYGVFFVFRAGSNNEIKRPDANVRRFLLVSR